MLKRRWSALCRILVAVTLAVLLTGSTAHAMALDRVTVLMGGTTIVPLIRSAR